mmetsp:Transcript_37190/g.93753  ORF Transcript_37190/g.93753 Transcript_37190/m.93753 type:complete len:216 (+) Transcript_37190:355-1002(+)
MHHLTQAYPSQQTLQTNPFTVHAQLPTHTSPHTATAATPSQVIVIQQRVERGQPRAPAERVAVGGGRARVVQRVVKRAVQRALDGAPARLLGFCRDHRLVARHLLLHALACQLLLHDLRDPGALGGVCGRLRLVLLPPGGRRVVRQLRARLAVKPDAPRARVLVRVYGRKPALALRAQPRALRPPRCLQQLVPYVACCDLWPPGLLPLSTGRLPL